MKIIEPGFFKRNKKIILIATLIMFVSVIVGAGIGYLQADGQYNVISNALSSYQTNNNTEDVEIDTMGLFIHNLTADLIIVIGGVFFSIISLISIIFNGISVGSLFGIDLPYAAIAVLPHGIIEYMASALSLAIAFKITKLEIEIIKKRNLKNTIKEHETDLKDILAILIAMVIILAIAAIIEANLTPLLVQWHFGL